MTFSMVSIKARILLFLWLMKQTMRYHIVPTKPTYFLGARLNVADTNFAKLPKPAWQINPPCFKVVLDSGQRRRGMFCVDFQLFPPKLVPLL